jgi:hypothetical protein
MKRLIVFGLLVVLILALVLAVKAFAWVFVTIFDYGMMAIILGAIIWAAIKFDRWLHRKQ